MVGGMPSLNEMVCLRWAIPTPDPLIGRENVCRLVIEDQRKELDYVPTVLFANNDDILDCVSLVVPVFPAAILIASSSHFASDDKPSTPLVVKMRRNKRLKRYMKKLRASERKEEDG